MLPQKQGNCCQFCFQPGIQHCGSEKK